MLRSKRSDRREKVCSVLAHAMNCFTSCIPLSFRLVPAAASASSNLSRALLESPAYYLHTAKIRRHGRLWRCLEASIRHCLSVSRLLRTRPPGSW